MDFLKYCSLLLLFLESCSVGPTKINKNEYGLQVINTVKYYEQTVSSDSLKKMVLLKKYISNVVFDWKYATKNNFTKQILYTNPDAFMRIEAAEALNKVAKELQEQGLGLKIFDAYRPYTITKKMWEVVPDERYAANPAKGSGHNRGAAIDLTLYNLKNGTELEMPTPYDDFTEKAHLDFMQLSGEVLKNRSTLINVMRKYGFMPLDTEWWHFYLPNAAQRFELMDLSFDDLRKATQ
ncbi:MAG: M15 family metallopeptidase [Chitinophagaceae bacterium]|jgi:D-alanyl-D-alanine dipeptidase|nr:M15 family metallopeptidase [Chitinophagaceae bacterium]